MNDYESAIVKRVVKSYLIHNGEASTRMIADHIITNKYELKNEISVRVLARLLRKWKLNPSSWFYVECTEKGNDKWWRLV